MKIESVCRPKQCINFENVRIKIRLLIGPCEQGMLLIWKIEDRDLFQHGVDGGKRELSKNPVVKGIIENFFWLFTSHRACRNILFVYMIDKFPGEFFAGFLVNMIIIIEF